MTDGISEINMINPGTGSVFLNGKQSLFLVSDDIQIVKKQAAWYHKERRKRRFFMIGADHKERRKYVQKINDMS